MTIYEIITALLTALGILVTLSISVFGFMSKKEKDKIDENADTVDKLSDMIDEDRVTINAICRDISTLEERSKNEKEMIKNLSDKLDRILERLK